MQPRVHLESELWFRIAFLKILLEFENFACFELFHHVELLMMQWREKQPNTS